MYLHIYKLHTYSIKGNIPLLRKRKQNPVQYIEDSGTIKSGPIYENNTMYLSGSLKTENQVINLFLRGQVEEN